MEESNNSHNVKSGIKENRKTRKIPQEKTLLELRKRKELYYDVPCVGLWISFVIVVCHCVVFLDFDQAFLFFGIYACFFLLIHSAIQCHKVRYHDVFGKKALEMGCPLVSRYENHQGESAWYTYAVVNEIGFSRLLALSEQDTPMSLGLGEGKVTLFSRKFCVEKVAKKSQIGRTIPNYQDLSNKKVKSFSLGWGI